MSDYFFYDLNKKMADLANKQQLAETAQATPAKPAANALRTQLNERDLGKHNNATTGFAALAKKTGGGEKGAKIAGAQLAKMRAKGQVEEGSKPDFLDLDKDGNRKEPMKSAARSVKKDMDESALQAAFGKKKYGDQGMKALQKAGRDHASDSTMKKIRNQYDKYDESRGATDEGNAFSGAVVKAKRDGIQPGEKITVGGKTYPVREDNDMKEYLAQYSPDTLERIKNASDDQLYSMALGFGGDQHSRVNRELDQLYKARRDLSGPEGAGARRVKGVQDRFDKVMRRKSEKSNNRTMDEVDEPMAKASAATRSSSKRPDPNVPGSMIVVGKDTGPLPKRKTPTSAPDDEDGSTAPPAKGPDGRYPIVTDGPNKGKRWSPATPGPTRAGMKEGGMPMTPKQQKFAKLAPPVNKITFADKIVGAKQASSGRNRDMEESFLDDEPTSRRSSTGGRIDTSEPGVTRHRAVKGNYSGAGHDASADDDEPSGQIGRRKVGAGQGKKIGAKINRGTSKLMTKEGNMPEDMIEPQDSGEYDREGDMAKDTIKTVVRHAQALEKILGDDDNLPEWVQSKLAKIENMMTAVDDYMQNQQDDDMPMEQERTRKRDNRAERAGRKVAKDIEYDEKEKDGIHGQRRGSEDSRAERAGKKVTKDIEYDEKKDKKKKEVDETTTSGSVATGSAPKSSGGTSYGKGIYDSLNRQLENMISESMNINMSINNDDHGGPRKSLTVTATDEDAVMLAGLLKLAGMGNDDEHMHDMTDDNSQMLAIQTMGDEDACSSCGASPCGCDSEEMYEGLFGSGAKAAVKLAPEAEAALAKYGPEVLQKIKDLIQSAGGPKITKLPYMGPPKEVDDFAAQAFKSPYEPGIAKPTNKIPTIDKAPQMRKSNDPPVFDKSTRQSGMARDPFDPLVDEDRWGAEQPPKLPNDMTVTADGGVDVKKSGSDWVYTSKEPGGRVTVTIPASASNKMLPKTDVDEAYGDTDASENDPDYPTDQEGTDDAMMYSGGLDGPKSTGQTTIPVIAGQDDRMGYNGDNELRRMMEIAGLR